MKKQDAVKLTEQDASMILAMMNYARHVVDEKDANDFEKFANILEDAIEKYRSTELVYASYNGSYPAYFTHTSGHEIDLRPVMERCEEAYENNDEFYKHFAEYFEEQGMKDHAEYVRDNQEELKRQYEAAYNSGSSDCDEFELEALKAEMYIGGGYGESSADSSALKRISELESELGNTSGVEG